MGFCVGDECPMCEETGHTGIFDRETGRWYVCPVCGDRGTLDELAVQILGEKEGDYEHMAAPGT